MLSVILWLVPSFGLMIGGLILCAWWSTLGGVIATAVGCAWFIAVGLIGHSGGGKEAE